MQNTHYFRAVGSYGAIGTYDFILNTQLTELQQDYSHIPYTVHVALNAELIRTSNNQLVAAKEFSITTPIAQNTPYGGVTAINTATAQLLQQLAQFYFESAKITIDPAV